MLCYLKYLPFHLIFQRKFVKVFQSSRVTGPCTYSNLSLVQTSGWAAPGSVLCLAGGPAVSLQHKSPRVFNWQLSVSPEYYFTGFELRIAIFVEVEVKKLHTRSVWHNCELMHLGYDPPDRFAVGWTENGPIGPPEMSWTPAGFRESNTLQSACSATHVYADHWIRRPTESPTCMKYRGEKFLCAGINFNPSM